MAYQHDFSQFNFEQALHPGVLAHPRLQYSGFPAHHIPHDVVYQPYTYQDVFDQLPHGLYPEGYIDDSNEPTTRPRLTPEQQAILENQFVQNPKPSSAAKKNLAVRTKLSPARVANWFQNRRAKAKQQRKQEEFENSQQQQSAQAERECAQDQTEEDEEDEEDKQEEDDEEEYIKPMVTEPTSNIWRRKSEPAPPPPAVSQSVDARERAYASLGRAIADAEAGLQQHNNVQQPPPPPSMVDEKFTMAPPELPRHASVAQGVPVANIPQRYQSHVPQTLWRGPQDIQQFWPSSPLNASDMTFDFGFDSSTTQSLNDNIELTSPSNTTCSQTYGGMSPDAWEAPMITPTMPVHPHNDYRQPLQSPCFPIPSYASSRRPSIADSLTNNLEQIVLSASTTPASFPTCGSVSSGASDAGIGLAARRKRPGLAPLKGEALRSRSYGTLTAASPTFRQGMTPPTAQVLRHTKSSGYSLNSQYAGVRKPSLPRKSPLAASFAESDFQKFMAQKLDVEGQSQLTPIVTAYASQPCLPEQPMVQFHMHQMPKAASHIPEMPVRPQMTSPPITPFQTDFFGGMHAAAMMPSSIQSQYASTADWTPPYSAGPLTNSSLSDAPLTSPDFAHFSPFPPVQFIPSLSPATRHHGEEANPYPWMFPADQSPQQMVMQNASLPRKSVDDFKINLYEFPNQKEAHAQATKQLPRASQPHHNVFVNESGNYFNKDKSPK